MRILHTVSPFGLPVSKDSCAGTEQIVYHLDRKLTERGISSTVIARGDSQLYDDPGQKRLIPLFGKMLDQPGFLSNPDHVQFATVVRYATELEAVQSGRYDLVHSHAGDIMRFGNIINIPVLTTLHFPIEWYWDKKKFGEFSLGDNHFAAISRKQRRIFEKERYNIDYVIYNGIDVDAFCMSPRKQPYLLTLGRICSQKGHDIAVDVAQKLGMHIVIAGGVEEEEYFAGIMQREGAVDISDSADKAGELRRLVHEDSPRIIYFGPANAEEKKPLFADATAFLMPLQWEESFGLVAIEAMASGTPVVAFKRGALPELIRNGRTGYLVDNPAQMVLAVRGIRGINPNDCRNHVKQNFSLDNMVDKYISIYEHLIGGSMHGENVYSISSALKQS